MIAHCKLTHPHVCGGEINDGGILHSYTEFECAGMEHSCKMFGHIPLLSTTTTTTMHYHAGVSVFIFCIVLPARGKQAEWVHREVGDSL